MNDVQNSSCDTFPAEPLGKQKAAFGARVMAFLLDLCILACLHLGIFLLAGNLAVPFFLYDFLTIFKAVFVLLVIFWVSPLFVAMAYFVLFHTFGGQTIGKMIMGIRVVSTSNVDLSPGTSFLRWVGYLVSCVPFGAGFYWSIFDKDHCAWHDRIAGTHVVASEMT